MMRLDDPTLVAFVDGELDAAAIREVALALESDPEAAEKVRQFRISAALVRTAFRDPQHLQVSPALARPIEAWLGDRLEREIRVPDLSAHGLTFRGARLLVVDGRPVGQLVYTKPDRPHRPLALCIALDGIGDEAVRAEVRDGVTMMLWRHQGYLYILAGWLDRQA